MMPTDVLLFAPGSSGSAIDATTPLNLAATQFLPVGRAGAGLDLHTQMRGRGLRVDPGDAVFWDPDSRRWIRGPSARVTAVTLTAWTPSGLIVLGPAAQRAPSSSAGQILRPAG